MPHNKGFKVIGPFLIVRFDKLPSTPWPVSVAGLAIFLTTNQFELPWKLGLAGDPRFKILSNRDCRALSIREDYDAVVSYILRQEIYEIGCLGRDTLALFWTRSERVPCPGVCGAAVLDFEGNVVSFFVTILKLIMPEFVVEKKKKKSNLVRT